MKANCLLIESSRRSMSAQAYKLCSFRSSPPRLQLRNGGAEIAGVDIAGVIGSRKLSCSL